MYGVCMYRIGKQGWDDHLEYRHERGDAVAEKGMHHVGVHISLDIRY